MIERGCVTGKVGLDDVKATVAVIVGDTDAHAGLRFAVGRVSGSGFDSDVGEGAVVVVLVEGGGSGVVGDVDVRPGVVVEVADDDAEAVGAGGFQDAGFGGDVSKRSVAIVPEQDVFSAQEAGRATGDEETFVLAGAGLGKGGSFRIEVDVVGDEEVEVAVFVVVEEGAAGVVASQAGFGAGGDAGFSGHINEFAVAEVLPEGTVAPVGDEEIVEAVIVEIANAAAATPPGASDAGFAGDVGKSAVAIVFVETADGAGRGDDLIFETGAVGEEDVEPAVVVVIDESGAATGGFEKVFIALFAAVDGFGAEAGFAGDVDEADAVGCGRDSRGGAGYLAQELIEGKNGCGPTDRVQESATVGAAHKKASVHDSGSEKGPGRRGAGILNAGNAMTCPKCRVKMKQENHRHLSHGNRKWRCPVCQKVRMQKPKGRKERE